MARLEATGRSDLMARIKVRDTRPEMQVRRALHAHGFRYQLHARDLPGSPDVVFRGRKVAIFIHGCFWHGCQVCDRGRRQPKTNAAFWSAKIAGNRRRDAAVVDRLTEAGWRPIIIWECTIRTPEGLDDQVEKLSALLGARS